MTDDTHVTVEELAAYLDRSTALDQRRRVESHLVHCSRCRADLITAGRQLPSAMRPRLMVLATAGLAAAALLVVFPGVWKTGSERGASDGERAAPAPIAQPIAIASPKDDSHHPLGDVRFIWGSAGTGVQYRVTLTDATGGPLWTIETADTALDPGPGMAANVSYFWFVDALLPDGRTRTSGTHRFTIDP